MTATAAAATMAMIMVAMTSNTQVFECDHNLVCVSKIIKTNGMTNTSEKKECIERSRKRVEIENKAKVQCLN